MEHLLRARNCAKGINSDDFFLKTILSRKKNACEQVPILQKRQWRLGCPKFHSTLVSGRAETVKPGSLMP